jgi:hypothetical protein
VSGGELALDATCELEGIGAIAERFEGRSLVWFERAQSEESLERCLGSIVKAPN